MILVNHKSEEEEVHLHLDFFAFSLRLFKFWELTIRLVRGLQVCVEENQARTTDWTMQKICSSRGRFLVSSISCLLICFVFCDLTIVDCFGNCRWLLLLEFSIPTLCNLKRLGLRRLEKAPRFNCYIAVCSNVLSAMFALLLDTVKVETCECIG